MKTSNGNDILSAIHNGDMAIAGGAGVAPILVRDRQGTQLFTSPEAWITKIPDVSYGKETNTVQWVFGVHNPINFVGGN